LKVATLLAKIGSIILPQNIECLGISLFCSDKKEKNRSIIHSPQKYDSCLPQQIMASSKKTTLSKKWGNEIVLN